jgi:hypothetical protein
MSRRGAENAESVRSFLCAFAALRENLKRPRILRSLDVERKPGGLGFVSRRGAESAEKKQDRTFFSSAASASLRESFKTSGHFAFARSRRKPGGFLFISRQAAKAQRRIISA